MFLFSLGNTLEAYTMDRARGAIRKLIASSPRVATRLAVASATAENTWASLCPW